MDTLLCDELLQEIMLRLPPSTSSSSSLVSKRWLHVYRTSKTSISLRITPNNPLIPSISSFLSLYPCLSSLTLVSDSDQIISSSISNYLLIQISSTCSKLRRLRFSAGPLSLSALLSLSYSCKHLTSLTISSSLPPSFRWIASLPSLKELFFSKFKNADVADEFEFDEIEEEEDLGVWNCSSKSSESPLESLSLSGIGDGDRGLSWLWKNCTKLKKLQLRSCEGIGDSFHSFTKCLKNLQELELRTCRTIVDKILLQLTEHCNCLQSLLLYDGGSKTGLLNFIIQSQSSLKRIDLRLPLDLENRHLVAIAENFRGLVSLRLESCYLFKGEGLMAISLSLSDSLEELTLINCDVVDIETGLLTTLGQNLKGLKKLDLSYNEMLVDKEVVSMLVSCKNLIDIKLRGCKKLTDFVLVSMVKCCKMVENVDFRHCSTIGAEAVEVFIANSLRLRRVHVEEGKLTEVAKRWALKKVIEIIH